jgi:hypothetical protein
MAASVEGVMDVNSSEFKTIKNTKRQATSPLSAGCVAASSEKKSRTEKPDHIIYIFGKNKNLTKENPIKLKKEIIKSIGDVDNVFVVAKKFLKIYCKDEKQKQALLKLNFLGETEIEISKNKKDTEPSTTGLTNMFKTVIVGVPETITVEEIAEETGCKKAVKLYKGQGMNKTLTSAVLLIYDNTPPEYTYLGFNRHKTYDYKPTPLRCYKCQRFGHTANNCNNRDICAACGGPHLFTLCTSGTNKHCVNCGGAHSAGYRGCPKYGEVQTNLLTSVKEKISYSEAAKINKQREIEHREQLETNPKTIIPSTHTQLNRQYKPTIKQSHSETQTEKLEMTEEIRNSHKVYVNNIYKLILATDKIETKLETFKELTEKLLNIQLTFPSGKERQNSISSEAEPNANANNNTYTQSTQTCTETTDEETSSEEEDYLLTGTFKKPKGIKLKFNKIQ